MGYGTLLRFDGTVKKNPKMLRKGFGDLMPEETDGYDRRGGEADRRVNHQMESPDFAQKIVDTTEVMEGINGKGMGNNCFPNQSD